MYSNALEEWLSMCSEQVEFIWNTENQEFRRAAMLFHVLKEEFNKIEYELNCKMTKFKQITKATEDPKIVETPKKIFTPSELITTNSSYIQAENAIHTNEEINKEPQSDGSPKINRNRKFSRSKKLIASPSLLDIPKENKNQTSLSINPKVRLKSDDLFDSVIVIDSASPIGTKNIKKSDISLLQGNGFENENVINSSVIVNETPDISVTKRKKARTLSLKLPCTKKGKSKVQTNTLTQIFAQMPTEGGNMKDTSILNSDDETYIGSTQSSCKNNSSKENKSGELAQKRLKLENFKDYDVVPLPKSKSPQHVHKTATVRGKAERMKLPGWSCEDCQQYYEKLNLPPEELQKKMNICSKHRNKFQQLNKTPKGYWDITMAHTQEDSMSDSLIFEI